MYKLVAMIFGLFVQRHIVRHVGQKYREVSQNGNWQCSKKIHGKQ